jgi:nicotinamidase/pyrazinamidase
MNPTLNPSTDVLLIIDVQNDFCPGGALAVANGDQIISMINRIAKRFDHTILTQDWHPKGHSSFASSHSGKTPYATIQMPYGDQTLWPDHCLQGSEGAQFHPALAVDQAQLIIRKGFRPQIDSYSAFYENDKTTSTGLTGYLRERGLSRVFLCGLATDFCVAYSAIDASKHGFTVAVFLDASRAIDMDGSLNKATTNMLESGVLLINDCNDFT